MNYKKIKIRIQKVIAVIMAAAISFSLFACSSPKNTESKAEDTSSTVSQSSSSEEMSSSSQEQSETKTEEKEDTAKETDSSSSSESQEETPSSSETEPESKPEAEKPKSTVSDDYFNDAVFIGDSRTEGLITYGELFNAHSLAYKGLNTANALTDDLFNINGTMMSAVEALNYMSFSKVYIMLGINELGWAYSSIFTDKYGQIIDEIKKVNPNAKIYIQSILPVSSEVSNTHDYITNKKINEYNELLIQLANEKGVQYLNVASIFKDKNGCLPEEAAWDGIHLKKPYCEKWVEYLKEHAA